MRDACEDTFCFGDATVREQDQHEAVLRFADTRCERTSQPSGDLVFDSCLTTNAALAYLQRGSRYLLPHPVAVLLEDGPRTARRLRLAAAHPTQQRPSVPHTRALDHLVRLRGYLDSIHQIAGSGLGHAKPTSLLTSRLESKAAYLVNRCAC